MIREALALAMRSERMAVQQQHVNYLAQVRSAMISKDTGPQVSTVVLVCVCILTCMYAQSPGYMSC